MLTFPNAKINIGLNITAKRNDGYHDLETVFYPIGIQDVLEIKPLENVAERGLESHAGRTAHSISSGQNDHLIGGITQNVIHQKHLLRYSSYHVDILTTWSELT
jgi:4-diphosphocytidyl-2C-methyl-D-erythritol kinase